MSSNYYIARRSKLLRDFDKTAKYMKNAVASRYEDDFADTVLRETRREYEALIPELPYIGGKKSPLTKSLIGSAWCLALYRALKKRGKTAEETGEIILATIRAQFDRFPRLLLRLIGRYRFSKHYLSKLRRQAEISRERRYPGDWVLTVIEGDGRELDYGIDYTECGICKFFHAHGADELVPYMCATDFPVSEALGTGLIRTTTLADGSDRCNFRFKKGRKRTDT